jgi:hypothetical protein
MNWAAETGRRGSEEVKKERSEEGERFRRKEVSKEKNEGIER